MNPDFIATLRARHAGIKAEASQILDRAEAAKRELTPAENAELDRSMDDLKRIGEQIDLYVDLDKRASKADAVRATLLGGGPAYGGYSNELYRPGGQSFFRDVIGAQRGDWEAAERLNRHERNESRDGTTGSTSMGSYIPPRWLVDEIAKFSRVGRVMAQIVRPVGEPQSNTETVPRVTTGASVAGQAGENAAVSETDQVTVQLSRSTVTIAGQQDVSIQSLELPNAARTDQIIFADLEAAYQAELDRQILRGSGTNELLGINQVAGINAVAYTDATPTVPELYPKLSDAIQQIHSNRKLPATAIVMHPRRWGWIVAALDTQNRPLVTPSGPMNGIAVFSDAEAEGRVGALAGVPIYTTANVATNLGAGTNEDQIVVLRGSDTLLLESDLRARVLPDVGSGNLTVRMQVYAFVNLFAGRYPTAITTIGGTGLITPTF